MPPIDFPTTPAVNDQYTFGSRVWQWNGTGWELKTNAVGTQNITASTADPSGGADGDIWIKYTA